MTAEPQPARCINGDGRPVYDGCRATEREVLRAAVQWATRGTGTLCIVCARVAYLTGHEHHRDDCWVPKAEAVIGDATQMVEQEVHP